MPDYFEGQHCVAARQHGPGQNYWYIGDRYDGYGAPQWPTLEAMLTDLAGIVAQFQTSVAGDE